MSYSGDSQEFEKSFAEALDAAVAQRDKEKAALAARQATLLARHHALLMQQPPTDAQPVQRRISPEVEGNLAKAAVLRALTSKLAPAVEHIPTDTTLFVPARREWVHGKQGFIRRRLGIEPGSTVKEIPDQVVGRGWLLGKTVAVYESGNQGFGADDDGHYRRYESVYSHKGFVLDQHGRIVFFDTKIAGHESTRREAELPLPALVPVQHADVLGEEHIRQYTATKEIDVIQQGLISFIANNNLEAIARQVPLS